MSGTIIIGGAYFNDARIDLLKDYKGQTYTPAWESVLNRVAPKKQLPSDWYFVFGLKKWVRRLKKAHVPTRKIHKVITAYLHSIMPPNVPMGVLDDCNLSEEKFVGHHLRKKLAEEFDCRIYLLREYLKTEQYSELVIPFSIPADDNTHLCKGFPRSWLLYFHGDASHKIRREDVKGIKGYDMASVKMKVYKGGEKSKDKMRREEYLEEMSDSLGCFSFPGAGYCTFRYQEIPSVGSALVTRKYPWLVRNDYTHKKTCIHYNSMHELKAYLLDKQLMQDVALAGMEHFQKYHTTFVRRMEFMEYLDEVRGN